MREITLLTLVLTFASCINFPCFDRPEGGLPGPDQANAHQLYPNDKGRLDISAKEASLIEPGDVIYLRGRFKSVRIVGLKGSAAKPITITNYPGETLVVGEPEWTGGAYCNAIQLLESKHIVLGGRKSKSEFQISGSVQPKGQGGYIGISLQPFTDNVEVKNIEITNGGVGIMSKTDPVASNPLTHYPNTELQNLTIHDISISNTVGVSMYIGHTSIFWGWDENGKGYNAGAAPNNPAHTYVQPVRWKNVKLYNIRIKNSGWDALQVASTDQLQIYDNEISSYGTSGLFGQCMGILVGGNSTNTSVHDNYVYDGLGDAYQFHGANGNNSKHSVYNNLFTNIQASGLGIYGLTDDATIEVYNNTVANCLSFAILANGRGKNPTVNSRKNLFIACHQQEPNMDKYIRIMNGAEVIQSGDKAFYSASAARVDSTRYYAPRFGSPVGNAGYRRWR